jgi:hypothetical protein
VISLGKISKSWSIDSEKLTRFLDKCKKENKDPNHMVEELIFGWTNQEQCEQVI